MFFSNFNAKVVGLENKVVEMESNISEMVAGLKVRDEKITSLVVSSEQVSIRIGHIRGGYYSVRKRKACPC